MGLVETKLTIQALVGCRNKWFLEGEETYSGQSGRSRIWLWSPRVFDVRVIHIADKWIHALVTNMATKEEFYITVVYGHNNVAARGPLWDFLGSIADGIVKPWLVVRDFNNVLHMNDRNGRQHVHMGEVAQFKGCIDDYSFDHMRWVEDYYTWSNRQQ